MKSGLRLISAILAGGVILAGCGGGGDDGSAASTGTGTGESKEAADLTFVIASAVIGPKEEVAVYAVGQEMGYFEEENLTVKTINADGSIAAVQAVGSGNGDITPADAGSVLSAVQKNVPVKAIGGLVQNWPWQMATLPGSGISSGKDLKGKKIGVISLASGSAPYARAFVRDAGLNPEGDVQLLPVGVGAQAAAALSGGDVDVLALYTQAYSVIESSGTKLEYLDNPDAFDGIRSLTWTVGEKELAEKPDVYERFLRAAYKALLFSAQNPEAAMQIGYKVYPQILGGAAPESRMTADVASLEAWLKTATPTQGEPSSWSDWGAITGADWEKTQEYTKEAGQISGPVDIDKVWDDSLLEGANSFDSAAVIQQADSWKS